MGIYNAKISNTIILISLSFIVFCFMAPSKIMEISLQIATLAAFGYLFFSLYKFFNLYRFFESVVTPDELEKITPGMPMPIITFSKRNPRKDLRNDILLKYNPIKAKALFYYEKCIVIVGYIIVILFFVLSTV